MNDTPSENIHITYVTEKSLSCNGGSTPFEHPQIYLKIGGSGVANCPYCRIKFIYKNYKIK